MNALMYRFRFMVFNTTFNNISVISWWSVLLALMYKISIEHSGTI